MQVLAYYRTSSKTNTEGDSVHRQARAVETWAATNGATIVACYWDAGVSGTDPVEVREGFRALLEHAKAEGIEVIAVEDASRFARDLMAQELGLVLCRANGVRVVTSTGQDLSDDESPERVMFRQMAGVIAHYDRAKTVQRLKQARDRIKATGTKVEGRKNWSEMNPELVKQAKRLARKNPKTGKVRSLRDISAELANLGFLSTKGTPLSAQSVSNILSAKS